ncbi:MAG TPA: tRNA (adenosine(37)-N6)-threonylcarbamoyltransferase complex ATPase subunit type 1 TsaE [Frankiaceae bacterium]|jgi:tRNA threonylcarbamoyladenosine biosynthesis protein TsaE|nr:tRNA (adenosine(37)-N6)-threonylcarbamoyltransferase complex ATPase subunit type 1 TsaE [Frankiaceae bacterium]
MIPLPTADDTRALGARVGAIVRPGDLIVLDGPLGAGKTVFVQGLAAGLGASDPVTSPTFVIARVHAGGRLPLVHVDAYRLTGWAEVDDLDLDTDLAAAVVAVEWGAGLVEALTDAHLRVQLRRDAGDDVGGEDGIDDQGERVAELQPVGGDWVQRLETAGLVGS